MTHEIDALMCELDPIQRRTLQRILDHESERAKALLGEFVAVPIDNDTHHYNLRARARDWLDGKP